MANVIRIDLEPDGFPGQWFEIIDIGAQSANQFQAIQELSADAGPESFRTFLSKVVARWHILNPATGDPLPYPSSTSFDIGDVPIRALRRFGENIQRQVEEVTNPKAISASNSRVTSS